MIHFLNQISLFFKLTDLFSALKWIPQFLHLNRRLLFCFPHEITWRLLQLQQRFFSNF